ncbi:O-methylsterigmatocystin oxidoreductase [Mycena sanguinolenta]|uniref:O-methylsterigmatocystin oxidoreductase n=1 Tax=Mycena sanguinolenta TaxID=230812 RepID=A0A8H7D108_9AGAR|nr:O-methylsterigmatocystin oxidoreductase [Mycena sanguinolenta]
MHPLALLVLAAVALRLFRRVFRARHRRHLPFPPGPPPYALIGNFLDLPTKLPWLTYTKWGIQYGDLVHVSAPGQHIIVVNSVKTAVELFEKRSHIYSDRPVFTMVKLMGWDFNLALLPRGDEWRMEKIHLLLQGLLSSPEEFREHFKTRATSYLIAKSQQKSRLASAIIMATVYGYDVQPTNDHFVALSESATKKLSDAIFPGAVAVDTFPILRYLPSWMPGAGFQRFAAECRQLTSEMQEAPVNFVKQNMRDGMDSTSVVAKLLAANRYDEVAIQSVAGTAYTGGADTVRILGDELLTSQLTQTGSAFASFCLAMALHPEIQKKAQTEIDTVIGTDRLPEFEDRPSLPFVEALYREVMRWRPVTPLGVAHASSEDDICDGYFIPKGTTVIANIWAMTRDESIYHEPDRFNPDRFFTANGKSNEDATILTFGFGRRICWGRHHVDATVWATIVSVLSTFNIAKAKDVTGKEIDIDPKYSDGLVSHPESFACSITPRSKMAKTLVQATAETHDV